MKKLIAALCLVTTAHALGADYAVKEVRQFTDAKSGLAILEGQVNLPGPGIWSLGEGDVLIEDLSDIFLVPSQALIREEMGERGRELELQQARQNRRRELGRLSWRIRQYQEEHEGRPASSLEDLQRLEIGGTPEVVHVPEGVYLVPNVLLGRRDRDRERQVVVFETHPGVDDGKHWVVYDDGTVRRREIESDLFARHAVELRRPEPGPVDDLSLYTILALRRSRASRTETVLPMTNRRTGASGRLTFSWDAPAVGERDILKQWGEQRVWRWRALDDENGASTLSYWIPLAAGQYGVDIGPLQAQRTRRNQRRNRQTNVFNMLGGRAAIRETLQLQALGGAEGAGGAASIPVASLPGVEVKSHPFEEMLAGAAGGHLALAEVAPANRLFAYFAQPENLLQFLEGGSDFLFRGGSTVTGRSLGYNLTSRYLARLGMNEGWIRTFLRSGAAEEMAILLPDLFLIEGTDVTVVARLKNPRIAAASLKLLGLSDLSSVVEHQVPDGQAYWTQRGDLLLVSTHKPELERVLKRIEDPSIECLGRSAEFRYMLTQLPLDGTTHSFFYISDPFIRQLVGPAAKIGQLRRLRARAELEAITAGALLYRADGHADTPTLAGLREAGYAPAPNLVQDAVLEENGRCASATYGASGRLRSLLAQPVDRATQEEADAYRQYLENYDRFWRRFFDPIAIRVNQPDANTMEVSTFILPLVDNSLYGGAREFMVQADTPTPLPLPTLDPEPVSTLSLQLNPDMWEEVLQDADFAGLLRHTLGIQLSLLDDLAPDVHIALGDADPIISMGSGGLASLGGIAGGDDDMFFISFFVSMLTRPCALLVGLNDPAEFLAKLRQLPTGSTLGEGFGDFGAGSLYKVSGRDAWRYVFTIEDVISMRFGIEVKGRYLVISNLPLSYNPSVTEEFPALHNAGALHLSPAACVEQLPALHASAAEQQLKAAMYGAASLYPLMRAGETDVAQAQALHRTLFGFTPLHPDGGEWAWEDGQLKSNMFGTRWRQQSPEHVEGNRAFGTLRGIDRVQAAMQFEQDGLRATCKWQFRE